MRRIWGDLRGKYFQNAFLLGTLYVDVSNDTVVVTKPKVEIVPFEASGLKPIADYHHFAFIARQYWEASVYPNHVLPELAPSFPMVVVYSSGKAELRDTGDYLMSLNWGNAFQPAEAYLSDEPMPQKVFEKLVAALKGSENRLPASPAEGRRQALHHIRNHRKKRWHQNPQMQRRALAQAHAANRHLAHAATPVSATQHHTGSSAPPMNILFIHQNFPGQFKFLAPALAQQGHNVRGHDHAEDDAREWQGVQLVPVQPPAAARTPQRASLG